MSIFLENFSPISCEKTLYPGPYGLNHPCLLTSISAAKNYDGWWELDCFTIRVLVRKHIRGPRPSLSPSADAHAQLVKNTSLTAYKKQVHFR